jgi:hypothetical protein
MSTHHHSLNQSIYFFVALGGIPTRGQGAKHVGIFVVTSFDFHLSEIGLEMRLGPHGKVDGICVGVPHPQRGFKYSN